MRCVDMSVHRLAGFFSDDRQTLSKSLPEVTQKLQKSDQNRHRFTSYSKLHYVASSLAMCCHFRLVFKMWEATSKKILPFDRNKRSPFWLILGYFSIDFQDFQKEKIRFKKFFARFARQKKLIKISIFRIWSGLASSSPTKCFKKISAAIMKSMSKKP